MKKKTDWLEILMFCVIQWKAHGLLFPIQKRQTDRYRQMQANSGIRRRMQTGTQIGIQTDDESRQTHTDRYKQMKAYRPHRQTNANR